MPINVEIHVHFASVDDLKIIRNELAKLLTLGEKTMSAFDAYVTAQKGFNDSMSTSISEISDDVAALNAKIAALQNAPGTLTTEQQAALDDLQATSSSLAQRLQAVNDMTPPAVPPG